MLNIQIEVAKLQALQDELSAHTAIKPGFLARLFGTKAAKVWKVDEQKLGQHHN